MQGFFEGCGSSLSRVGAVCLVWTLRLVTRRSQNNRMKVSKMTRAAIATALAAAGILFPVGSALASLNSVTPAVHNDPSYANLVFAAWLNALGCPTNGPYPCYPPVDLDDTKNEGLLLSKQGSSSSGA